MKKTFLLLLSALLFIAPLRVSAVETSAKAAVLINGDTGEVIYSHNADARLPMASTTKIMTALLLCEYGNFDKEITVTPEMVRVEGSSMGLLAGDRVTLGDLLYGLLLASGNDAANVIAYTLGGSVQGFVELMNEKAQALALNNTHFETPSGLDGEAHYTSASDLASLTRYAMEYEDFAKAVCSKSAVLYYGNPPYRRSLTNHNKLLKLFDGAIGVKTGFTKKSGRCLVSAAKRDGKYVIAVTLNDPNDWNDHCNLLEYGLKSIKQTQISPTASIYNIPLIGAQSEYLSVEIKPYTVNSLDTENLTCEVYLPQFLYSPITQGEKVGYAVYKMNGEVIDRVDITADESVSALEVRKNPARAVFDNFLYILTSFRS